MCIIYIYNLIYIYVCVCQHVFTIHFLGVSYFEAIPHIGFSEGWRCVAKWTSQAPTEAQRSQVRSIERC
jgi:hypothetical protein